jgi:hypothetical protein
MNTIHIFVQPNFTGASNCEMVLFSRIIYKENLQLFYSVPSASVAVVRVQARSTGYFVAFTLGFHATNIFCCTLNTNGDHSNVNMTTVLATTWFWMMGSYFVTISAARKVFFSSISI